MYQLASDHIIIAVDNLDKEFYFEFNFKIN